jgi:hypothetical protein
MPRGNYPTDNGRANWESGFDITHSLRGLVGPLYGEVVAFMKRPRETGKA